MERCFEEMLVELCAPTLCGIKPGNLFRYCPANKNRARAGLAYWNGILSSLGLSVRILKECSNTGALLVFVFRIGWLERILQEKEVKEFLQSEGYNVNSGVDGILGQLSERLCLEKEFPHEIGVFLGYPLTDVLGFIRNRGENYTCCGYWKSYGDPAIARRRFRLYRVCTDICRKKYRRGISVVRLIRAA